MSQYPSAGGNEAFPNLGRHCSESNCHLLDFLPFRCDACNKTFCLDHRSYGAHRCADVGACDVTVAVCARCSASFKATGGADAREALARHTDSSACKAGAAVRKAKCPVRGCRQRLTTSNRVPCKSCQVDHCLRHRLALDHQCAAPVTITSSDSHKGGARPSGSAGARFLEALARRTGSECGGESGERNGGMAENRNGSKPALSMGRTTQAH